MAFDLNRLFSILVSSGLQSKDPSLYQVIYHLINALKDINVIIGQIGALESSTNTLSGTSPITINDDSALLPNSRALLAGLGIIFDDTVAHVRTIIATGNGIGYWTPLTDGDVIETDLIFADGDCIMVFHP